MRRESSERRQHERKTVSDAADITVVGNLTDCRECFAEPKQEAEVVTESNEGLRLITNYPLKPGNLIKFSGAEEENLGVVLWTVTSENFCKAEVFLLDLPQCQ